MRQPGLIHPPLKCLVLSAWIMILMAIPVSRALGLSQKTSLQEVSEGLTCQCGCGLTVANCNHPQCEFSVPVREHIGAIYRWRSETTVLNETLDRPAPDELKRRLEQQIRDQV